MKNRYAVGLGKLAKGKKKTMSEKALDQRRKALVKANEARILQNSISKADKINDLQQCSVSPK